jgi:predicted ABC-class ATPase
VTDRGDAGSAVLSELALRQAAGQTDLAEAFAEELSFIAAIWSHSGQKPLTSRACQFILSDNYNRVIRMDETTRSSIRHIFLSPRPHFALLTVTQLLGMTLKELKREIEDGAIVAVSTAIGQRMSREELVALAMQTWSSR